MMLNAKATSWLLLSFQSYSDNKPIEVTPPNGKLKVLIDLTGSWQYSVIAGDQPLFTNNKISLNLEQEILGNHPEIISIKKEKKLGTIQPFISLKYASVQSIYNKVLIRFKKGFDVEFRAFDDGLAYRFIVHKRGRIKIYNEDVSLHLPTAYILHLQQTSGFKTSYEDPLFPYLFVKLGKGNAENNEMADTEAETSDH